jgi:ATP-dependent Clp protease protease subunit
VINRRVFLSDIDETTVDYCVKGMYLMETNDPEKPIELFINSYGGTIYDAMGLYNVMETLQCPVHTFAYSKCMSAAPLLLAAGEPGHRWVAAHCSFMHHDWADSVEGKGEFIKSAVKHTEKLGRMWTEEFAKHTNKTFKWWDDRAKKSGDFYFTTEDALEWGVADSVWSER